RTVSPWSAAPRRNAASAAGSRGGAAQPRGLPTNIWIASAPISTARAGTPGSLPRVEMWVPSRTREAVREPRAMAGSRSPARDAHIVRLDRCSTRLELDPLVRLDLPTRSRPLVDDSVPPEQQRPVNPDIGESLLL